MASEEDNQHNDVVAIDLPAPSGWYKKCTLKRAATPQRNDIVFISPTGEEIKSKRQLDQYLKSHPGGPAASEFDWGSGDSPRRSVRLSAKSKPVVTTASWAANKKQKRSSKKGAQVKSIADAEVEATGEKDATAEEAKEAVESSAVDAKDAMDEDVTPEKPNSEDVEKKTDTEIATEEPSAAAPVGTETESKNVSIDEPKDATTVVPDAKMEESKETSEVPSTKVDEYKEESHVVPDAKNDETKEATDAARNDETEQATDAAKNDETEQATDAAKIDETKEATDAAKKDEAKEASNSGKETPDEKVDSAVTASEDVVNSNVKEAEEKPIEKAPLL